MALKLPTTFPGAHGRDVSASIASGRAAITRCDARLDCSRLEVLRADAVVRRIRAYLEGYDQRWPSAASPFTSEDSDALAAGASRSR